VPRPDSDKPFERITFYTKAVDQMLATTWNERRSRDTRHASREIYHGFFSDVKVNPKPWASCHRQ
jgi:hypothetical protein